MRVWVLSQPYCRVLVGVFASALLLILTPAHPALAGSYFEAGTSMGGMKNGDNFFGVTDATASGGFVGSFSFYFTTSTFLKIFRLDYGIQNRFTMATNSQNEHLAMLTPNLALRLELWRAFVGAGYSPMPYGGESITSLKSVTASSYFLEGGLIWRVVPEFQIVAAYGLEYGRISGSTSSSPINTEYGLRFRFPINPKEQDSSRSVKWDGFRYPFGFMRD